MVYAFADAIIVAADEISIEIANSQSQLIEAQRLRHKVYVEERDFEPGVNGLEQDAFDASSSHVLIRNRLTGAVCGTVRLVLSRGAAGHKGFPMQRACERYVLAPLPALATGEISRFALTRDRSGISAAGSAMMRLFLMRGIVQVSGLKSLTHWCAIMESSLIRLLRATAIHFQPVGPMVEHHGTRQPTVASIGTVLDRIRWEQPAVWSFLTANGSFWSEMPLPAVRLA
jgi:N-acyl amino acid synthase of PEP-CTERM/exosortase system